MKSQCGRLLPKATFSFVPEGADKPVEYRCQRIGFHLGSHCWRGGKTGLILWSEKRNGAVHIERMVL